MPALFQLLDTVDLGDVVLAAYPTATQLEMERAVAAFGQYACPTHPRRVVHRPTRGAAGRLHVFKPEDLREDPVTGALYAAGDLDVRLQSLAVQLRLHGVSDLVDGLSMLWRECVDAARAEGSAGRVGQKRSHPNSSEALEGWLRYLHHELLNAYSDLRSQLRGHDAMHQYGMQARAKYPSGFPAQSHSRRQRHKDEVKGLIAQLVNLRDDMRTQVSRYLVLMPDGDEWTFDWRLVLLAHERAVGEHLKSATTGAPVAYELRPFEQVLAEARRQKAGQGPKRPRTAVGSDPGTTFIRHEGGVHDGGGYRSVRAGGSNLIPRTDRDATSAVPQASMKRKSLSKDSAKASSSGRVT